MPLSRQDKEFYEQKLGLSSYGYVFGATMLIGALLWPALIFIQDWSAGQTGKWSLSVTLDLALMGFLLGSVLSTVMYLALKFLLSVGWLPARR